MGINERQTAQLGSLIWTTQPGHLRPFSAPIPIPAPLRPARPAFFKISEANDVPEKDPIGDLESAARLTHMSLVSLETVSVELISSYFAQFPEIDTTLQMLLARHCFDEARHCRLLWNLLRSLGKDIDTYTHIDIRTWVVNQQLKTLSQKVAVSHRLLESFGVEACASVARKLRQLGLAEAAMTYEVQHIDEIAHVRSADLVVRHLEGDNYTDFMCRSFDWFVKEVPRVHLVIDETVRAAEGFTNEEISRFKSWS